VAEPLQLNHEQFVRLQDYLEVFGSDKGQRVLADMRKEYCGSCFHNDPLKMAFWNGRREVVLDIESILSLRGRELVEEKEEENA